MFLYPKAAISCLDKSKPCQGSDRNGICCLHALGRDRVGNTSAMWATKKEPEEPRSPFSV